MNVILEPEQKATLYLTCSFNQLLSYLNSSNELIRVDLAFKYDSGLYFYSVKDNYVRRIQKKTVSQVMDISEEVESSVYAFDASYKDINRLFRRQAENGLPFHRKSLLSEPRYIGQFDQFTKVYAALIGHKNVHADFLKYLFSNFVLTVRDEIKRLAIDKMDFPVESEKNHIWHEISRRASVQFLSEKVFQDPKDYRGEELYEALCLVSSAAYEKAPNHGKMGLLTEGIENKPAFIRFSHPVDINRKNVRQIRKLLEMSDAERNMLMIEKGRIAGIFTLQNGYDYSEIAFHGNGKWDFRIHKNPVISFDSISFSLNNRILEIKTEKHIRNVFDTYCDADKLKSIIDEARKQPHGTTIIVTDCALEESNRLSKADRAIKIEPIEVKPKTIQSITAIDGAIMLDPYGKCYAIGAILDGVSSEYGNLGRGARYNSAITYVDYWSSESKNKILAVIVSADDSIDFYPSI